MAEVEIPYKPRNWAARMHASWARFFAVVLHRRAGKTTAVINHHQRAALDDAWEAERLKRLRPTLADAELRELVKPPGGRHYGHVMPTRVQAKEVVWDKLKHYAGGIPGVKFNESELLVRYPGGAKLQLFGSDNPDALRGPAFSGLSFDEYSQQPQNIFSEVLSKALADHLGYAMFLGTIKGKDHLWKTHEAAKGNADDWFSLWQDIDRSIATEEGITIQLLEQAMAGDRKMIADGLMTQDEYDQEWYLSTEAAIKGAYFGKEMAAALKEGRITRVPYDPALPVDTDWDLGIDDDMFIWFSQSLRSGEIRLIDCYANSGEGFQHYIDVLNKRGYVYGKHYPPHDIAVRELGTGKSRKEVAAGLGLKFQDPITGTLDLADGINAARLALAKCWFDAERCKHGIEALRQYRKTWNARTEMFTHQPVHNWASHGSDAFRGLAVRHKTPSHEITTFAAPPMPGTYAWS